MIARFIVITIQMAALVSSEPFGFCPRRPLKNPKVLSELVSIISFFAMNFNIFLYLPKMFRTYQKSNIFFEELSFCFLTLSIPYAKCTFSCDMYLDHFLAI